MAIDMIARAVLRVVTIQNTPMDVAMKRNFLERIGCCSLAVDG